MPRKRRNRRNKKNNQRQLEKISSDENSENTQETFTNNVNILRHCSSPDLLEQKNPHLDLITPLRTPTPTVQKSQNFQYIDPIKSTPVNKSKSLTKKLRNSSRFHMTNLNILFDSEEYAKNVSFDIPNNTNTKHDKSCNYDKSIEQKLSFNCSKSNLYNSNCINQAIMDCSTQTDGQVQSPNKLMLQNNHAITETPKIKQCLLLDEISCDGNSNYAVPNNSLNKSAQTNRVSDFTNQVGYADMQVNYNPYLQNNEALAMVKSKHHKETNVCLHNNDYLGMIKNIPESGNKDHSVGEMSFFTPQLFAMKSASTPIDHVKSNSHFMKDVPVRDGARNMSGVEVLNKTENVDTVYKSCSVSPLSLSKKGSSALLADKNTNIDMEKEMQSKSFKAAASYQGLVLRKRLCKSLTPKINRYASHSKMCNRSHKSYKTLPSRKFSMDVSERLPSAPGACERFFTKLKKYTRMSAKWSLRVVEMCTQLGVSIKKNLTTLYQLYSIDNTRLNGDKENQNPSCKCEEYLGEINMLSSKIHHLVEDVHSMKTLMDQQRQNDQGKLTHLADELCKTREELTQLRELRNDMESLRKQVGCIVDGAAGKTATPKTGPPPPPPPPPPPLPPSAARQSKTLPRKKEKKGGDNMRPIISLEDILKVKLKKTADRQSPLLRRSGQPVVSMDMLKQVKLKPTSRPQTPSSLHDTSSNYSSVPTSPASSLTRLLNDNSA